MAKDPKLYIRKNSKIHANGLFAKYDIEPGARIIEYRGLKITKAQSDKIADVHIAANKKQGTVGAVYIFTLNERYDINGKVAWNLAKYINHSCDPNCEVEITNNEIWISAIKNIKEDTELTYNYGYPFDSDFEEHICKCGTKKCVVYILSDDDWPKLKKYEKKHKKDTR